VEVQNMSRTRTFRRWTVAALLTGLVGIGAAGCIAVPVGGYGGPELVLPLPVPGVVIAPGYYGNRGGYYGSRGGYYRGNYGRQWNGRNWRG
jgi:hypothetical protein